LFSFNKSFYETLDKFDIENTMPKTTPIVLSELNNQACFLIKARRYDEAIALLTQALRGAAQAVKSHSHQPEASCSDVAPGDTNGYYNLSTTPSQEEEFMPPNPRRPAEAITGGIYGNLGGRTRMEDPVNINKVSFQSPYVYNDPLLITNVPAPCAEDAMLTGLSYILTFNLALSHHLSSGIENKNMDKTDANDVSLRKLQKSKRLYELNLKFQNQGGVQPNFLNGESNLLLLTAAVLNNLSVVNKSLNNHHDAEHCDQSLLNALLILIDLDHTGEAHQMNDKLSGFVGNLMYLIVKTSFAASAA
jgi:hypothetical protein